MNLSIWRGVTVFGTIVLLAAGCGYDSGGRGAKESASAPEAVMESSETTQENTAEEVFRRINEIDFSIAEHPIDTERYSEQADNYKSAFLKAVTNQIPIYNRDEGISIYYKELLQKTEEMKEEELLDYIKQSDYYYQDFDSDGLPELIVDIEGPCVLKYDVEKDQVVLYYKKDQGWNLLGSEQMVYTNYTWETSADTVMIQWEYAYEIVSLDEGKQSAAFYHTMVSENSSDWIHTYSVSVDRYQNIEMDEEEWRELAAGYFNAKDLAPHPMSFSCMFGDDMNRGYDPGTEPKPRYLLEELDPLPMNEETGEEWEVYKAMLKGDFSLVEDERWARLQSRYESSLEDGNGRCNWSYFLMDFNQDGWQELCIRFRDDEVNNTAFFRYEDRQVKMWGSYNSADSHGYEIPLQNGRIMSVYWYQNDMTRWIERFDSEFNDVRERHYSSIDINDEEEAANSPDNTNVTEEKLSLTFQDYYHDGQPCGSEIQLSEEEWAQVEDMIEALLIPESAWKPCSAFSPASERPEIPGLG